MGVEGLVEVYAVRAVEVFLTGEKSENSARDIGVKVGRRLFPCLRSSMKFNSDISNIFVDTCSILGLGVMLMSSLSHKSSARGVGSNGFISCSLINGETMEDRLEKRSLSSS